MINPESSLPTGGLIAKPVKIDGKVLWVAKSKRAGILRRLYDSEKDAMSAATELDEEIELNERTAAELEAFASKWTDVDNWVVATVTYDRQKYFMVVCPENEEISEHAYLSRIDASEEADRRNEGAKDPAGYGV